MLMKLQNVLYKTRNKLVMYYRAVVDLFDFRIFHTFPLFLKEILFIIAVRHYRSSCPDR